VSRCLFLLLLLLVGCQGPQPEPAPEPETPAPRAVPPPTVHPAPARLVALGDVHGDHDAMLAALSLAGVIDDDGHWTGGETVVVQTGDQLDRGDAERRILDHLETLADEAHAAGGALLALVGNHETMNVELDLRYVTPGGYADFADLAPPPEEQDALLQGYPEEERGRVAAFRPGGPYARLLAGHNTVVQVGDTVFVHGGVLPGHAEVGLEEINRDIQDWMRGDGDEPSALIGGDGPVWVRDYSDETSSEDCASLATALATIGATRMVVGHTVHDSIHSYCADRVWRVDVGMAAYYGGPTQVLEIRDSEVSILE